MKKQKAIFELTLTAVFIAILLVFNFTFLGFLRIGVIEISLMGLPIAVGAMLLGIKGGAILGTTFGVLSFIQCFGASAFGVILMGINPIYTFIVCLVPRILMGIVGASVYKGLNKTKLPKPIACMLSCLSCAFTNTIGFVGLFIALFSNTEFFASMQADFGTTNIFAFVVAFVGINGLVEALASGVIGLGIAPVLKSSSSTRMPN